MPALIVAQDAAALVGGQRAGDLERRDGGVDRLVVLGLGGVVRGTRRVRGVGRVVDLEDIRRFDPASRQEDRMGLGSGGDGHACSVDRGGCFPA
jgi:hypothetical protein